MRSHQKNYSPKTIYLYTCTIKALDSDFGIKSTVHSCWGPGDLLHLDHLDSALWTSVEWTDGPTMEPLCCYSWDTQSSIGRPMVPSHALFSWPSRVQILSGSGASLLSPVCPRQCCGVMVSQAQVLMKIWLQQLCFDGSTHLVACY